MPHTLPPSWSEVNVPVDIGSLERWQDTHRSYTYHLQLMKYPVTRGRKICLASSRDVLCYYCYCSVESWKWRILCLIPCCWSPLKRDGFFMCNVRIWSWTCQKHEKKTKLLPGTTANQLEHIFSESDYHIISLTSRNLWIQPVVISDFTGRQAGKVKVPSLG